MSLYRYLLSLLLVLSTLLAGCASTPAPTTEGRPVEREPEYRETPAPVVPAPPAVSAPSADLLQRAAVARQAGDYEQALALLERAQRIEPDSAEIYLALATTHRDRGDDRQARATAERGLLYCRSSAQCEALRQYTR